MSLVLAGSWVVCLWKACSELRGEIFPNWEMLSPASLVWAVLWLFWLSPCWSP